MLIGIKNFELRIDICDEVYANHIDCFAIVARDIGAEDIGVGFFY